MTATPDSASSGEAHPAAEGETEHEWDERARQLTGEEDVSDVDVLEEELDHDGKGRVPTQAPAPGAIDPDAPGRSVLDDTGDAVEPNEPA